MSKREVKFGHWIFRINETEDGYQIEVEGDKEKLEGLIGTAQACMKVFGGGGEDSPASNLGICGALMHRMFQRGKSEAQTV